MMKYLSVLGLVCLLTVSSVAALYSWPATPSFTDPDDGGIVLDGQDILAGFYASDSMYHYFRMDIQAAPIANPANYSGIYGVYIESLAGQGAPASDAYVPAALDGIDYIVDFHFNPALGTAAHFHAWDEMAGAWEPIVDISADFQQNSTSLEWKILKSEIDSDMPNFTINLATHDDGSSSTTHDYAPNIGNGFEVPEPATMAVLGFGGLLISVRRKK